MNLAEHRALAAPYPDVWLDGPERMVEKAEKMLGQHRRWGDRGAWVLGIVIASRGVIEAAQTESAHQRMTWLRRLAAIENEIGEELR